MASAKRLDKGFCPLCGRVLLAPEGEGIKLLADGSRICSHCVRRVRVMYPIRETRDKRGAVGFSDPMSAAGLDQVREAAEKAIAYTEELRAKYGFRNAVFLIERVEQSKGGLGKPPRWDVDGQVLYGNFDPEDKVTLEHGGAGAPVTLTGVSRRVSGSALAVSRRAEGGNPCALTFFARGVACEPGDLIVKE